MKPASRKLLMTLCLVSAATSAACLVVLRSGRPLYYTDGDTGIIATELIDAPMLVYREVQPVTEIPGPLVGRVQELPDGKLIYGRGRDFGRTDLVVFDPSRPQLEPVAASILNSPGHEFSPALSADGVLYFASDRAGGQGGFDLYTAIYIEGGFFSVPRPLGATINSVEDEVDPAPHPEGTALVFVRRLASVDEGRNGKLLIAQLNSDEPATSLWKPSRRRIPLPVIDREPAFSSDGVSLWFVREEAGSAPNLHRSWRHIDAYVDPVRCRELENRGPFRSPQPAAGGFALGLIKQGDVPLLYLAKATEVYPWWAGQRSLELFLFLSLLLSLLLLMLLLLGTRWHQLDFITWCIILSLLLHLLIWMLLSGVEMVQRWVPSPASEDRLSVRLISMQKGSQSGGGEFVQKMDRLAERLTMRERQDQIVDGSPETALAANRDRADAPDANRSEIALRPVNIELTMSANDTTETLTPLAGRDSLQRVDPETGTISQAQSEAESQRAVAVTNVIEVVLPATGALPVSSPDAVKLVPQQRSAAALKVSQSQASLDHFADAPQRADVQPSQVRDLLAAARPRSVSPQAAVMQPAHSSQRSTASPEPAPAREKAEPGVMASMVAARTRSPRASRRQADLAQRVRVPKATLQASPAEEFTAPSQNRVAEPALPSLASSSALRALDPGQVARLAQRAQPELGADSQASLLVPAARQLTATRRRFDGSQRSAKAINPAQKSVLRTLRDAASIAPPAARERTSEAAVPGLKPKVAILTAASVVLNTARDLGVTEPTSMSRSITAPRQRALPSPARRDVGNQHRPDHQGRHMRAAPRAAVAKASEATTAATRTLSADAALSSPVALSFQVRVGPQPADLLRLQRGGEQSDGPDWISTGLRLPSSYLVLAPRRTDVDDSAPTKEVTLYSNRFGPRKTEALARFGGTEATERAVAGGLAYLAGIQKEAGHWGTRRHFDDKYGEVYVGKTALCLLAFLGAGHTHESDTEYSAVVERTIAFLLSKQDEETGHFGSKSSAYSHGISTYALAECYAITSDASLRRPIEHAIARILSAQSQSSDRRNRGGWGYFSPSIRPEDPYSRTSVSSWMVMALKSAELSGIQFPDRSKQAIKNYLWRMYDRDRRYFLYSKNPSRLRSSWRTLPASTPAGVFSLLLLGAEAADPRLRSALQYTTERAPKSYRRGSDDEFVLRATGNVYFWYYGSLACFTAGGETWNRWNERLRTVLPKAQNLDGSFNPVGSYASYAGDTRRDMSYTTVMVVLSLEVYYRYFTPLLEGR